jgi:CRP-like cAMP-binding protein
MPRMDDTKSRAFQKGQRIITKGNKAGCAYLIVSGEVRVFLEEGTKSLDLATLGPQEIFGESAIFSDTLNGAHVEAISDCVLLPITPETFTEMLSQTDPIIQSLIRTLIERLKVTNEALLKSETREFMDIVLI